MDLLAAEHADAAGLAELLGLPTRQLLDGVDGKAQGTEQTQAFTVVDASRPFHTEPS